MADSRVAFSVVADWSGRKFKMMLDEKDLASMKVEKIKRTLAKFTNLQPDDFILRTDTGRELVLGMRGGDFDLCGGMLLRMFKAHGHAAAEAATAALPHPAAAPAPPPPAAPAPAPAPAPTLQVEGVAPTPSAAAAPAATHSTPAAPPAAAPSHPSPAPHVWDANAFTSPPSAAQPPAPPPQPAPPPAGIGRLTPPPPQTHAPHAAGAMPKLAAHPSSYGLPSPTAHAMPSPHGTCTPPGMAAKAAPVAASPYDSGARGAAPSRGVQGVARDVSPLRPVGAGIAGSTDAAPAGGDSAVFGPSLWSRNGLSDQQHQLQQRLAAEASSLLGTRLGGSGDMSATLTTPLHPSWNGRQPPSPAALEAKISELRAENEQLRLENSAATRQYRQRVMERDVARIAGSGAGAPDTSSVSRSPLVDRWLATREETGAPPAQPVARPMLSKSPARQVPDGDAGGALAPARTGERIVDDDMRALLDKCRELAQSRSALEDELQAMKRDWTDERRQRMQVWEREHSEWAARQQQLIAAWEADKQRLLSQNLPSEEVVGIHRKWEASGDGAAQRWHREKAALLQEIEECKARRQAQEDAEYDAAVAELRELNEKKKALYADVQQRKVSLSKSRHETEQNKLFVVAASQSLEALRERVVAETGLVPERARLLVQLLTEKAMLSERAASMRVEEQNLHQSLVRETALRKHLHNTLEDIKGSIRAIVRMRPLLPIDQAGGDDDAHMAVERGTVAVTDTNSVVVTSPTTGMKDYQFYRVLAPEASQEDTFAEIRPLLQSTLDGFNACVMAYGQTGSGKTYTIMGEQGTLRRGVLPRAVEELFGFVRKLGCDYEMRCSMVELYLDALHDLLTPDNRKCELRQLPTGLQSSATERVVATPDETLGLLKEGTNQRQVHSTLINPKSSRSHAVFTILLRLRLNGTETSSKLSFVDLAGSERVKVSHSKGDRLKEAQMINKSLSALGDVVAALSQPKQGGGASQPPAKGFVPYRNSKLTMILQDALGGNSKTVLFACICPASGVSNITETVSTLVFASRIKNVYNPYLRNITHVQNKAMDHDEEAQQAAVGYP